MGPKNASVFVKLSLVFMRNSVTRVSGNFCYISCMKIFAPFFLLILISGCSKLSTGVYWADTFTFSQLDDYFLLSGEQTEISKKEFKSAFIDLRKNEFPLIAEVFIGLAEDVEKDRLSVPRLDEWNLKITSIIKSSALRFEKMGQYLVEQQVANKFSHFDQEFESRHKKRLKKISSEEDRIEDARKRVDRVISESIGKLSKEQEALLPPLLRENPLLLEQESKKWLFTQFQLARKTSDSRNKFVEKYFRDWESLHKPEYIQARNSYRKKSHQVIVDILRIASPTQKERLVSGFRERAREFLELAKVK